MQHKKRLTRRDTSFLRPISPSTPSIRLLALATSFSTCGQWGAIVSYCRVCIVARQHHHLLDLATSFSTCRSEAKREMEASALIRFGWARQVRLARKPAAEQACPAPCQSGPAAQPARAIAGLYTKGESAGQQV